jgi:CubicO group peptidase (beta-lactamase class C family)
MTLFKPFLLAVALAASGPALALDFAKGDPAALGFDPAKLQALDASLEAKIEEGQFPGAIVLVVRDGKVAHFSMLGQQTAEGPAMSEDAIFRLYSMTKPIVSAATMRLIEQGLLSVDDKVSKYIPAFAEMAVATGEVDAEGKMETVPAVREITIHDLLTHTSGIASRTRTKGPVGDAYRKERVFDRSVSGMESAEKAASIPLQLQPGERLIYGESTNLLGVVIEEATGKRLGEVLDDLILGPLQMTDTRFRITNPADKARLAEAHPDDKFRGKFPLFDPTKDYLLQSASYGLVGTVNDYARFCQMLLNGGELEGARVLSEESVDTMLSDQLGGIHAGFLQRFKAGFGYGFLVAGLNTESAAKGLNMWGGAAGTTFWVDRKNEMFGVFMIQSAQNGRKARNEIRPYVYGGLAGHQPD